MTLARGFAFTLALALLVPACAEDDEAPPPSGPAPKGTRLLGIDVSQAQGEDWNTAYAKASETGMDFITFPLNWNSIEPGPDDDFAFVPSGDTALNENKWNRVAPAGATFETQNGALRFADDTASTVDAIAYTRYEVDGALVDVALGVSLAHVNEDAGGYNFALLLSFTQDGDSGNSAGPADAYVAIVSSTSGGVNYLSATCCDLGTVSTPATVAVPAADLTLEIRRTATDFEFLYDDGGAGGLQALHTLSRSGLATAFGDPARCYLYFGNAAGNNVEIAADDWTVAAGDAAWDTASDKYITGNGMDILGVVDTVYGAIASSVALSVRTINTVGTEMPSDLERITAGGRVDFSDPRIADRCKLFLEHVRSRTPNVDYLAVSIGNEIDGYLGADDAAWAAYGTFAQAVLPHVKAVFGAQVPGGAKGTFGGIRDASVRPRLVALNAHADAVFLTWYPLESDFTARGPGVPASDFDEMISAFASMPSKPIYILEAGYPSATLCASSEADQAAFFGNVFAAWDERMDRIAAVSVNWLTDVSQATVDEWEVYYGISDPVFLAYLGSIGLRNHDGSEKQAFGRIVQEAEARGW